MTPLSFQDLEALKALADRFKESPELHRPHTFDIYTRKDGRDHYVEGEWVRDCMRMLPRLLSHITALEAEKAALQAFKDYVHQRLDEAGIPTHPDGEHSKAGCRVGDRLDLALAARRLALEEANAAVKKASERWAPGSVYHQFAMDLERAILALKEQA